MFLQTFSGMDTTIVGLWRMQHNSGGPQVALSLNGGPWVKTSWKPHCLAWTRFECCFRGKTFETTTVSKFQVSCNVSPTIALALDDQAGNFEVGKDFDALRVNVAAPGGPIDLIQHEEPKVYRWFWQQILIWF